jgi:hypothetical protein
MASQGGESHHQNPTRGSRSACFGQAGPVTFAPASPHHDMGFERPFTATTFYSGRPPWYTTRR